MAEARFLSKPVTSWNFAVPPLANHQAMLGVLIANVNPGQAVIVMLVSGLEIKHRSSERGHLAPIPCGNSIALITFHRIFRSLEDLNNDFLWLSLFLRIFFDQSRSEYLAFVSHTQT